MMGFEMITETNNWRVILGWLIDEKQVQALDDDGEWVDPDWLRSDAAYHLVTKSDGWTFRLKPRTIKVNGRDIVEPEKSCLECGQEYWMPSLCREEKVSKEEWDGCSFDKRVLQRGLVHLSKENAIAHAKAMLGID